MPATKSPMAAVTDLLRVKVIDKLKGYQPETPSMPFHDRLFGRTNRQTFSLIQSLNTTLGMSVFEEVARLLAAGRFTVAERQYRGLKGYLS